MFRRLRLPGKLALAAMPLMVLVAAAATLLTLQAMDRAQQQDTASELAATWTPLGGLVERLHAEEFATLIELGRMADQSASSQLGVSQLEPVRAETDAALAALRDYLGVVGDPVPMVGQLDVATITIDAVRAFFDDIGATPESLILRLPEARSRIPEGYELADGQLLEIGDLIVAEVSDVGVGRQLASVTALSRAMQSASTQDRAATLLKADDRFTVDLETIRSSGVEINQWISAFEYSAPDSWIAAFRESGLQGILFDVSRTSNEIVRNPSTATAVRDEEWRVGSDERRDLLGAFQEARIEAVVESASDEAAAVRRQALTILLLSVAAVLAAMTATGLIARSIVNRVRAITDSARKVSQIQLPALVEALRDPGDDVVLPTIAPIRDRGADEVGDLARSFSAMQSTLEHVASQQVEVLRKGVADMFVTLARRNRSLIDRQLSMIDDLEQKEENPDTLAQFYQLDHLATRMRRNAESLLVLAATEPQKKWRTPLEVDDVVRAALGEVEDYRRIDVLALEAVRLKGNVVADLAHLISELLENATSFSPPETRVRIAGHFQDGGYLVTITDRGVGIPNSRLAELNQLLVKPPVVGLAIEPTLGIYVVAMLAKRHGIRVRLVSGAPGITAHILVPVATFEVEVPTEPRPSKQPASGEPGRSHRKTPETIEPRPREAAPTESTKPLPEVQPQIRSARPNKHAARPAAQHVAPAQATSNGLPMRAGAMPTGQDTTEQPSGLPADGPGVGGGDLPTRKPGESFSAPNVDERPVDTSVRDPEQIKSSFSSFQLGVAVGRGSQEEGEES